MALGRPRVYTDEVHVRIVAKGENKLQSKSDRRAVIELLVNNRGRMTIGAINKHFGFDMTHVILRLRQIGWVEIEAEA